MAPPVTDDHGQSDRGATIVTGVQRLAAGLIAVGLLAVGPLAACAGEENDDADGTAGPYDAAAELRPDLMTVDPEEARPGEVVTLRFPEQTRRGIGFVLEAEVDDAWELRYLLTAAEDAGASPSWRRPATSDGHRWPDVEVDGPGPNWIQIPHVADPGSYRVCTADAEEAFCAPIEVTG